MDINWLASEAKSLHLIFSNMFFVSLTTFLSLGVILEYFKIPLGQTPQFSQLVGRAFTAALLLVALPEVMNIMADLTDAMAKQIGQFIEFKLVIDRLREKYHELSWSWVSVKDSVMILISYGSFFFFYVSIYLADALFLYSWMLIYIFSPLLISLYIFPATSSATTTLFKSILQVCSWKIVWCVMSALLWSMALSEINKPENGINFLTVIILNIMLATSVLVTPLITSSFFSGGIASTALSVGGKAYSNLVGTPAKAFIKNRMLSEGMKRAYYSQSSPKGKKKFLAKSGKDKKGDKQFNFDS